MAASPPPGVTAANIFIRAQTAWNARALPAYESFTLPCDQTFLADRCAEGTTVQFIVRMSDGRSFAQTIDAQGRPGTVLLRGGLMVGPAGAPFGFYRKTPVPGRVYTANSPQPVASDPVTTIASVTAVDRAYDVTLDGRTTVDGYDCYRLRLRPLRDPVQYPLRELLVDRASYQIVALTYAQPFNTSFATVNYRFAPVGAQHVWSIVHIDAEATSRSLFSERTERVSQDLRNITFPPDAPASDFSP